MPVWAFERAIVRDDRRTVKGLSSYTVVSPCDTRSALWLFWSPRSKQQQIRLPRRGRHAEKPVGNIEFFVLSF